MGFSVYVYRRLRALFVFPLVALWLVSPQMCLKHCYLWPTAFFTELLNHVNSPSPEFQMQAVEKLAIASAWQVGSISVLSSCKAWASSRPRGTSAGCAFSMRQAPGALDQCCREQKQPEPQQNLRQLFQWVDTWMGGDRHCEQWQCSFVSASSRFDSHWLDWLDWPLCLYIVPDLSSLFHHFIERQ